MAVNLTPELLQALRDAGHQPPEFVEPETGVVYVLIAKEQIVTRDDVASVQRGLDQLDAGQGRSLSESKADVANRLGFAVPQ